MKMICLLFPAMMLCLQCFSQTKDTVLKEVVVRTNRPLIRQEADRIIYDLHADPQSQVSSVLDMMRKVPYLSVDANDNVLLKGSMGYKVFINGRPSGLVASNPKAVLSSMPASTIKSIEVILNPPAKYDAEGLAGIINIITIKQVYDGYKGTINITERGPVGGPGAGGTFTFKQDKLGISVLAGISRNKAHKTTGDLRRSSEASDLHQHTTRGSISHTAYAGVELSYEVDTLHLLTGELNWNRNESSGVATQVSALTAVNYGEYYSLHNDNGSDGNGVEANVNFQQGFRLNKKQLLTFSYRYLQDGTSLHNDIVLSDEVNYSRPDYRQYNAESLTEHTAQVDYVQPVGNLTIEGGIKGIFRLNESDFQQYNADAVTGTYESDPLRSNTFNNTQQILAAYNSYGYKSKNWELKTGVRAEQTTVWIGHSQGTAPLQQQYVNLLPSLVVSRKLDDRNSLSFSYSRRIQRPSTAELNPFIDRSNPNFESSGNPYLRPITSDAYYISYMVSAKATVNISVSGLFFHHVFSLYPIYDAATSITLTRYENYGNGRVLKTNLSLSYPITNNWNVILNSDIRHVWVYGMANGITVKNSGWNIYAYASSGYSFKNGWKVNADITYRMGGIAVPLGNTNGMVATSFSVNKGILQSKLTVSAAINNPFTKYRYAKETIVGPNFLQASSNQSYYRRFTISLNYRFGKLKEDIRRNKRRIKNDDIGG